MTRLARLKAEKAALIKEATSLNAKVDDKSITDEESARLAAILAEDGEIAKLNAKIASEQILENERRTVAAVGDLNADTDEERRARVPAAAATDDTKKFATFGEQMIAVVRAGQSAGIDPRLQWQAASGQNEAGGGDGGYLVQTDFLPELMRRTYDRANLASRARRITAGPRSNGLKINALVDDSRANGSRFGGIQAFWTGEGAQKTASQMQFRQMDLRLHKLTGLLYATDELLEDAPALESLIQEAFGDEFAFKIDDAIFEGTGAGMPMGIMNSPALISIAKESSQTADTVVVENVVKMWARLWARSRMTAVWLINQQIEPQLMTMKIGDTPIYLPNGTIADAPYARLLGRPIIPTEFNSALGDKGDICLFDLQEYLLLEKGNIKRDVSIHVRFINDETTFRFVIRLDGQPIWDKPATPFKGSDTLSPFVTLDDRA